MIDFKPACHRMIHVLAGVRDDQLSGATPCAEFTVRDLIAHVDRVSRGFTALAHRDAGAHTDTDADPATADLADDWREGVARRVRALGEAWDDPVAWQGNTTATGLDMSNELWGKIALTEVLVHGWDLARATDQPFDLPEETLRACLDHVAEFVPNAPVRGLWGAAVEAPADGPLLNRLLAITGRAP